MNWGLCRRHTCGFAGALPERHELPALSHLLADAHPPFCLVVGPAGAVTFMLLPANLLPITRFYNKGLLQSDTIFSGIMALYRSKMSGIATIVLDREHHSPHRQILGWGWICWQLQRTKPVRRKAPAHHVPHHRFYRALGPCWICSSHLLMVALVWIAACCSALRAGPGATAFAGVVVLTMMSARMLDTRLLWDKAAR